ncbi:MAG: FHA domain-containing protein [Planctomycetota bacterium]|nr:FHA domain-containing protein [Planctomycetota bacterium]
MDDRFSLRFQSTERRGEVVAIPRSGLTVGRKPGNTLQILDNSVSGKHAELVVDPEGVLLRDLGSTNGTRIGGDRVLEKRLADGAVVVFGNIELVFRDAEADGPALEGDLLESAAPAAGSAGAGLERVDASLIARAGKRSPAALVGLGAVVLAAAGLGAWFWLRPSKASSAALTAVEPVPGNLLATGYSFEGDRDAFEALESAPAAFLPNANARRSGAQGARAELAATEWALHRSAAFRVGAERVIRASGSLRTRGEVEGRLGVEFSVAEDAESQVAPITAWAASVRTGSEFTVTGIQASVPPGYAIARVVILARAVGADSGGVVDADDISAVEAPSPRTPAAEISGAALFLHGDPPVAAQLARVDRVLLTGVHFTSAAPGAISSVLDAAPLSARIEGGNILLAAAATPAPTRIVLRVEGALANGGIASTGKDGYRTAGASSERDDVESLLLGRGADLVRVGLPGPCKVRGSRDGAAVLLSVELGSHEPKLLLQLDFSADKGAAEDLAHAARGAEKKGELGAAMSNWRALLDRFPYEAVLVEEAEATRAKLLQQGLAAVRDLQAEAERARFFALPNMYSSTRERALAVAVRYAGSEVEADASRLASALEAEVATLRRDEDRAERGRLSAMLGVLEKSGAKGLAEELRARLAQLEGRQ